MYELLYILPNTFAEAELPKVISKVEGLLKEAGAEEIKAESLGNIKLAYKVKKQTHGNYVMATFTCDKECLTAINRSLKLEGDIVRFSIDKQGKESKPVRLQEFKRVEPGQKYSSRKGDVKKGPSVKDKSKVKIEDVDEKKIDEILEKEIV